MDWQWMSQGGTLLDGTGDIAFTTPLGSLQDMVATRLKAALDGWKLYRIGADLDNLIGSTADAELEVQAQRQILAVLTTDFLPSGTFDVRTLLSGNALSVFVYLNQTLIASATTPLKAQ